MRGELEAGRQATQPGDSGVNPKSPEAVNAGQQNADECSAESAAMECVV